MVHGLGFTVHGSGFRVHVYCLLFTVYCFRFEVSGIRNCHFAMSEGNCHAVICQTEYSKNFYNFFHFKLCSFSRLQALIYTFILFYLYV
jgi:hypothetical protein